MTTPKIAALPLLSLVLACGDPSGGSGSGATSTSSETDEPTDEPPTTGTSGEAETESGSSDSGTTSDPSGEASTGAASTGEESTVDASTGEASTGEASAGSTGEASTGDLPAPTCEPGDGGGVLVWSQSEAQLPGFMPALAGGADDSVVLAGQTGVGDDGDAFVELRDAQGATLWSDLYAGVNGLQDRAVDVAVDPAGFIHVLVAESILAVEGEQMGTYDGRLVVLRYAPDGAHVWRWEHERPPAAPWTSYSPGGKLAVDGQAIFVVEHAFDGPFEHVRLDAFGNVLGETTLAVPAWLHYNSRYDLGPDGSVVIAARVGDPDRLWVGRFDDQGASSWSLDFEDEDSHPDSVLVGEDGAAYVLGSLNENPGVLSVRKFSGDGSVAWTQPLPDASLQGIRFGGAIRPDGALLLLGGNKQSGQRMDLWAGMMAAEGALLWTFEHEFGPPHSWGDGNTAAFTSSGAVVVSGSFDGEGGKSQPWLGRLCGG
ncbi:hypothetical protein OV203_18770 [Nannocystis sp. ILAH1]|uniref:hypothetical protein n=1 Tax=unclassified Nannocystis TaxID=2627009 RepID=UPI002270972A|nr:MULTISPECIES: hypothetical protein [unclassified Nannocystis]MCY0987054.1 hypothetical protein [Nannocystis sp. ILAH1]MCY0989188.1 hypothetical protein [Nannocystis sp. ILAH1]MCY1071937.1 hypothetical protein [Nannocystis sp. RBIL2]